MVCAEAKQKDCHRGRGRGHRDHGLKISGRPSEVPLPGGPSALGWRLLLLHRAREPRGPAWSSRPDTPSPHCVCLGGVMSRCGPLPSGRRPFFFPLLPLPVESRQKPLIACPRATGRRFIPSSFPRTTAANARRFPFPRRASFFQGVSPCAKMIARSGKKSGKSFPHVVTPSDGPASWPSSACSAWSDISTTPPSRSCARPSSSASRSPSWNCMNMTVCATGSERIR